MDPQSEDYQFGVMATEMKNLRISMNILTVELKTLGNTVDDLKLFKEKTVGMAIGTSAVISAVIGFLFHMAPLWVK